MRQSAFDLPARFFVEGAGGLLVPLVSLAGVATLQPVLLARLGRPAAFVARTAWAVA